MFEPDEVFVVRVGLAPPLVERARVGARSDSRIELFIAPAIPILRGENVRLLAKSDLGRFSCHAVARGESPAGRWFDVSNWVSVDLRENQRVPVDLPAVLTSVGAPGIPGIVRDVSVSGFLVIAAAQPRRREVELVVQPGTEDEVFPCRVVGESATPDGSFAVHLALDATAGAAGQRLADLFERESARHATQHRAA